MALAAVGVAAGMMLLMLTVQSVPADFPAIATSGSTMIVAAVTAMMFAIALGASWVPAVRVSRIAPVAALRAQ